MSAQGIRLIVGLGNPGSQYAATRHNAGAWFVEQFCQHYQVTLRSHPRFHGRYAYCSTDHLTCRLLIPTTFMNRSGVSVKAIAQFYRIPLATILVVHDELDLPPGVARFKQGGSTGGHNGLKDIVASFRDHGFWRLRLGIGHPGHRDQVHDYVLGIPSAVELALIQQVMTEAKMLLPDFIQGRYQQSMQCLHTPLK